MKKKILSLLLISSFPIFADIVEYKGKVNDILIGKSEVIKVGVVENDTSEIMCQNQDEQSWKFTFERGHSYSEQWFETLNLVRRTQETIRIGYLENEDSECAIEYLALLKDDGTISDTGQINDSLERRGEYGNVAQLYTNGLTEASYHASNNYNSDVPAAAFDGYIFGEQITENEGNLISRGIWLVKKEDSDDEDTKYWLQVEFEEAVNISGFRVLVNGKSAELGRGPRHVTILTSLAGDEFEEQGQYSLSKSIDQRANLPTKTEAKIFRLQINSNFGDSYIEIDELEVYAN